MNETGGMLQSVVRGYLEGDDLDAAGLAVMRAYLRQWMEAPWAGEVATLRADVEAILTTDDLRSWLRRAAAAGVDPL